MWERYSRKTLDDDQRIAVFVMMAQDAAGKWAAKTTGREKTRQNGKGDEVEVVELWGLVQRAEAILHTVHDAVMLSTQTQQRMLGVLEGHADLRKRIGRVWKGTGQQMIEMRNGGTIWYRTRTAKGGLGVDDVDRVVVDEAQEATKEHIAAISPTLLANSNPQMNALGTAGKAGVSAWWWKTRKRALSPDPGAFGYIGTTAENVHIDGEGRIVQEPVDVEDRALWLEVNPAIRAGRGDGMAFLEEQFRRMGDPARFAREHLCVWDPPDDEEGARWELIAEADWKACTLPVEPGWMADPVTLALEITQDRGYATIAAAGAHPTGRVATEIIEHRPVVEPGPVPKEWIVDRIVALHGHKPKALLIDPNNPAGSYIRDLTDRGIEVHEVNSTEYARACGSMADAIRAHTVAVNEANTELTAAAAATTRRDLRDSWVFDRRGKTPITPLSAVTLARWGHLEIEPPPERSVLEEREPITL